MNKITLPALLLTAFVGSFSLTGISARASEVEVPADGSAAGEVSATFTIDDELLAELGYNVVASVPLSLPLNYNASSKKFANSGKIFCRGIVPSGKKITINVNEAGLKYGKLYDPDGTSTDLSGAEGFNISLSRNEWSKAECYTNLSKIRAGDDASVTSSLSVTVPADGFIPTSGGTYTTYVPLTIRQESAL